MANHKSALKRIRANGKRRLINRYYSKTMRNAVKRFTLLENKQEAQTQLPRLFSMIDKLAKKSLIHKNKAANMKSRLARQIVSMQ